LFFGIYNSRDRNDAAVKLYTFAQFVWANYTVTIGQAASVSLFYFHYYQIPHSKPSSKLAGILLAKDLTFFRSF
jgi:hypothetical protein